MKCLLCLESYVVTLNYGNGHNVSVGITLKYGNGHNVPNSITEILEVRVQLLDWLVTL